MYREKIVFTFGMSFVFSDGKERVVKKRTKPDHDDDGERTTEQKKIVQ